MGSVFTHTHRPKKVIEDLKENRIKFSSPETDGNSTEIDQKKKEKMIKELNEFQDLISKENKNIKLWVNYNPEIGDYFLYNNNILISFSELYFGLNKGALFHEIGHYHYLKQELFFIGLNLIGYITFLGWGIYRKSVKTVGASGLIFFSSLSLISRYFEKQCDLYAVKKGYKQDLIDHFEKSKTENKKMKTKSWLFNLLISKNGDDRLNYSHPALTTRIKYLEELNED